MITLITIWLTTILHSEETKMNVPEARCRSSRFDYTGTSEKEGEENFVHFFSLEDIRLYDVTVCVYMCAVSSGVCWV